MYVQGKYTWKYGDYEEGEFKNNVLITGKVKYTYFNNDTYVGEYEGDLQNGKRHGNGKYTYSHGDIYEGEYKDDIPNGQGKYTYSDGSIYEGEYKDFFKNGKGKLTIKNIYILDGKWNDDLVVDGIVVFDNLPLKIELINLDKEEKPVIININNNKFTLKLNEDNSFEKIIDKEEKNVKLKENFDILLDNDDYSSIKYVNAMNFILRSYGEPEISNIYKFLGLPISFESKMNFYYFRKILI